MDPTPSFLEFVIEVLRQEPNASFDDLERSWSDTYGELPTLRERRVAYRPAGAALHTFRCEREARNTV